MPLQPSLFLDRMVRFLMPYFATMTPDPALARAEILETLESYGVRTRAEILNAVQIIAFSFSALEMLAEAKETPDLSPSAKLRFRSCANGMNRASQQNEKALEKRLAYDIPNPNDTFTDEEMEEQLRQTQAIIERYRDQVDHFMTTGQHAPATQHPSGSPLLRALGDLPHPHQS
jgi:hypothetical protein